MKPLPLVCALLFASSLAAFSQCDPNSLCRKALTDANNEPAKKRLLKENWNDYFGVSLENTFKIDPSPDINVVSIRFDALGCIYPEFVNDATHRTDFVDKPRKEIKYDKLTFYALFKKHQNLLDSRLSGADIEQLKNVYADKSYAKGNYDFREQWNKHFLQATIDTINQIVTGKNIKKVFFFIHGFNVPYALAHLQGNNLFRTILSDPAIDLKETLFVRVFWPSLSEKTSDFMGAGCKIKNKQIKVLRTRLFSYVSNRGYLCGRTLNDILNQLPDKVQYNFISHSFGSSIAAAMILSPETKISDKQANTDYNMRLRSLFTRMPTLQSKSLNFFMHAAGMPGMTTFANISAVQNASHTFYFGYNKKDKILQKKVIVFKFPARFSSTTLGCNKRNEAVKVVEFAGSRALENNFFAAPTSTLSEHDIFCYVQQPEFKRFFNRFMTKVKRP